jgi:Tol biopolymer transport system component
VRVWVALVLISGCDYIVGLERKVDAPGGEAPVDAIHDLPFGAPTPVVLSETNVDDPSLTGDRLQMFFNYQEDIWVATRPTLGDAFTSNLVSLSTIEFAETTPEVSFDGLTMWFAKASTPGATEPEFDIWMASRATSTGSWGGATLDVALSSMQSESAATTDERKLVMVIARTKASNPNDPDLYETRRISTGDAWGPLRALDTLNTTSAERSGHLSPDGLALYFQSNRTGLQDLYVTRRASLDGEWTPPRGLMELNTATADEEDPWVSPDGTEIYFASNASGTSVIYTAKR